MRLRPLGDRIVVKPHSTDKITKSGIILPSTGKETHLYGTVVSVGAGRKFLPMSLKPQDEIAFPKNMGSEQIVNGETFLIIRESEVFFLKQDNRIVWNFRNHS